MPARATAAAAVDRVERLCSTARDARSLRLGVLEEIRRVVPFDAFAWPLTDPETGVGTAPLAQVPCVAELEWLIRLRYLSEVNRWSRLDGPTVAHLADLQGTDHSGRWAAFLREHGTSDVVTVPFRDRYGLWGWLDLWRADDTRAVAAEELRWLRRVTPTVTHALRTSLASTFGQTVGRADVVGPLVLVLGPGLEVLDVTPRTPDYLQLLVPPAPGGSTIPANAYNVAAQLLAVEHQVDGHAAAARTHLGDGRWVTVRAARLGPPSSSSSRIAVTIEACTPAEHMDVFSRVCGLSVRETEVLRHLAGGADTRDVARQMNVSGHTVQDHLRSMFAKTATHSRRSLVARATPAAGSAAR